LSSADRPQRQAASAADTGTRRSLARGLLAAVLLAVMAGTGYLLLQWEPRSLPVRVVKVEGDVHHLSRERLAHTVISHLHGGILTQNLNELKVAVEALPWVRTASLTRIWPDRLDLNVAERQPFARWGEDGLVTAAGVVFRPSRDELPAGLPRLAGPDAQAPLVVQRFTRWRDRLEAFGLRLDAVTLDARGAWTLDFAGGLSVRLGVAEVEERVARLLRVYAEVALAGRPAVIDMRYSNGLAVRWADASPEGDARPGRPVQAVSSLSRPAGTRSGHSTGHSRS
jgi:cell division protein FtsQ